MSICFTFQKGQMSILLDEENDPKGSLSAHFGKPIRPTANRTSPLCPVENVVTVHIPYAHGSFGGLQERREEWHRWCLIVVITGERRETTNFNSWIVCLLELSRSIWWVGVNERPWKDMKYSLVPCLIMLRLAKAWLAVCLVVSRSVEICWFDQNTLRFYRHTCKIKGFDRCKTTKLDQNWFDFVDTVYFNQESPFDTLFGCLFQVVHRDLDIQWPIFWFLGPGVWHVWNMMIMSQDIFEGLKVWERTHTKSCKRMISTKCYMFIFVYHIALLPRRAGSGWWLNAPTCQDYSNYARSLFQRLQVTQYKVRLFLHMRVVFVRGIPIIEAYFYAHILLVPVLLFIIVFNLLSGLLVPSSFFLSDTKRAEISINGRKMPVQTAAVHQLL